MRSRWLVVLAILATLHGAPFAVSPSSASGTHSAPVENIGAEATAIDDTDALRLTAALVASLTLLAAGAFMLRRGSRREDAADQAELDRETAALLERRARRRARVRLSEPSHVESRGSSGATAGSNGPKSG